ncbi:DUF3540 domain-containing protein [Algicola sagamiensis]|uniref:DUF3540 domain-containing protein n=1 Tax=Algicola sagamiensis TaxID=163869 RepID=UPI00035D275D|nr:DUF3540 domain-containing protein [Algicola sagamiensis]
MNQCLSDDQLAQCQSFSSSALYVTGTITSVNHEAKTCLVDGRITCQIADGLMIQLHIGDWVACLNTGQSCFVIQILQYANRDAVSIQSNQPIRISAPQVQIAARDELDLVSLNRFSLVGKHGVISVAATLVNQAEHFIQQMGEWIASAKGLIRVTGRQQVITAEEDVRIDGKRINMG